jgi:hypothetical protein
MPLIRNEKIIQRYLAAADAAALAGQWMGLIEPDYTMMTRSESILYSTTQSGRDVVQTQPSEIVIGQTA